MEAQQCVQLTDTNRSRAWSHLEWEQSFLIDCSITNLLRNIFSTIFTDLKSHLRLDVKILCFLYDSYVCCVVVSLRKRRLRKKIILVSYRTYRGNDMTCRRKRIYALYICTDVFLTFRTLAVELWLLRWLLLWLLRWRFKRWSKRESEGKREKDGRIDITIAAIMAERIHLFPFRTQKLSFLTPKVLCGTPLGRIGHRRFSI